MPPASQNVPSHFGEMSWKWGHWYLNLLTMFCTESQILQALRSSGRQPNTFTNVSKSGRWESPRRSKKKSEMPYQQIRLLRRNLSGGSQVWSSVFCAGLILQEFAAVDVNPQSGKGKRMQRTTRKSGPSTSKEVYTRSNVAWKLFNVAWTSVPRLVWISLLGIGHRTWSNLRHRSVC